MHAIVAALLGGLINITGSIAGRVLVALGISVVTYTGTSGTLTWLRDQAVAGLSGAPANLVQLLSFMKVGVCISIVFSAILARMLITGLNGETVKRWVLK